MTTRENQGYIIMKKECYNRTNCQEIVLAFNPKKHEYVTWECQNKNDYFWGHYFSEIEDAMLDYHARLVKKYFQMIEE